MLLLAACASESRVTSGRAALPKSSAPATAPADAAAATVAPDQPPERPGWRVDGAQPPAATPSAAATALRETATPTHEVDITLDRAPIAAAAEAVLGDALQRSYRVDPQVVGEVSVKLVGSMTETQMLTTFDQALRASGAALIDSPGGGFAVVPVKDAPLLSLPTGGQGDTGAYSAGGVSIYRAHSVSAAQIAKMLQPLAEGRAQVRADPTEEHVFISGDPATVNSLTRAAALFDVDYLQGRSFQFYPLRYASASAVADDVRKLLGGAEGPIGTQVELLDIDRLNAIIIVAKSPQLLDQTAKWIERLDQPASPSEQRLRVVHLSNLVAADFVKTISDLFARGQPPAGAVVGPNHPTSMATVTADPRSNSVIMFADDADYQSLLSIVRQLDVPPPQVLIEATVAEVTLNNQLRFGVQYFLQNVPHLSGGFSPTASSTTAPNYPALALTYLGGNVQIALDALSTVTDVEVLSTPRMLVLANDTATLQVGDSVPIITQSSTGTDVTSLVINSVQYRDTGVVLTVTPRVGDNGEMFIDVQQEVSQVAPTTSSTINSPTIQERKFHTQIEVENGQSVAIGGLIQTSRSKSDSGIPYLSQIPVLGAAFRERLGNNSRTELVVFLKPTLVRSRSEADAVTQQLSDGLKALHFGRR